MQRIREIAQDTPLDIETLTLARRAARRRVVIKGRRGCFLNLDSQFDEIVPSGGTVFYGIINV